jgi:hypothetical protein
VITFDAPEPTGAWGPDGQPLDEFAGYKFGGMEYLDEGVRMVEQPFVGGAKPGLSSAQLGRIIGWGEGQGATAVQQTINTTQNLTRSQVQGWAKQGLTKSWVQDQLTKYSSSLMKGGDKLINTQLMHRKALIEKILNLWE